VLLDDLEVSSVETDVLVLGGDREATDLGQALADLIPGMRGVYAGRNRNAHHNAHQVEALTANLININRRSGWRSTGQRSQSPGSCSGHICGSRPGRIWSIRRRARQSAGCCSRQGG
jgi:hypothetical protein